MATLSKRIEHGSVLKESEPWFIFKESEPWLIILEKSEPWFTILKEVYHDSLFLVYLFKKVVHVSFL